LPNPQVFAYCANFLTETKSLLVALRRNTVCCYDTQLEGLMSNRPDFPTMIQVENASHEMLARWYRFLPTGTSAEQQKIMDRIAARFKKAGGMTPEISKRIGLGGTA
jgi:hypothetical protein